MDQALSFAIQSLLLVLLSTFILLFLFTLQGGWEACWANPGVISLSTSDFFLAYLTTYLPTCLYFSLIRINS